MWKMWRDTPLRQRLIDSIFPNYREQLLPLFTQWAILAAHNESTDAYNIKLSVLHLGTQQSYIPPMRGSIEFWVFEHIKCRVFALPRDQNLRLASHSKWLIMTIINPPKLLTNGTCCVVTRVMANIIEATITTRGRYYGETAYIPRIPLINSDGREVCLRGEAGPVPLGGGLCHIKINRSQGQTFDHLGRDFTKFPFTHG